MKQQFMSKLMFQTLDCDILNTCQCFYLFKLQGRSLFNRMIDLFGVKNHGLTSPILNELPSSMYLEGSYEFRIITNCEKLNKVTSYNDPGNGLHRHLEKSMDA